MLTISGFQQIFLTNFRSVLMVKGVFEAFTQNPLFVFTHHSALNNFFERMDLKALGLVPSPILNSFTRVYEEWVPI